MPKQNKIIWVNFLHMYQPPWQERGVLERVAIESYDYLITLLEKYPQFMMSLNISGSLLEQLVLLKPGILARLRRLVLAQRIELVGTAYYHPVLPLIGLAEASRQIKLNEQALARFFPGVSIRGFYLPEMAFSLSVAKLIKKRGYQWLVLDPIHYRGRWEENVDYRLRGVGLKIVFRDRLTSKDYPPRLIYEKLKDNKSARIITATDAEIYGHFHRDWQGFIEKILANKRLEVWSVSQHLASLKQTKNIMLRAASWESTASELRHKNPYSMWADPKNKIHQLLWELVSLASSLLKKYRKDKNWLWARGHLDRGLSSCTWWWATARRLSPFAPLSWNPDIIDSGAEELVRSVRSLEQASAREKIQAEKIYLAIRKHTWFTHWRKYNKK